MQVFWVANTSYTIAIWLCTSLAHQNISSKSWAEKHDCHHRAEATAVVTGLFLEACLGLGVCSMQFPPAVLRFRDFGPSRGLLLRVLCVERRMGSFPAGMGHPELSPALALACLYPAELWKLPGQHPVGRCQVSASALLSWASALSGQMWPGNASEWGSSPPSSLEVKLRHLFSLALLLNLLAGLYLVSK